MKKNNDMKRTIFIVLTLLIVFLFIGCSTAYKTETYKTETESFTASIYVKSFSYKIKLPEGYKRLYMTSGEGGHNTYQYSYPDTVMVYVAERYVYTPNDDNIRNHASKRDFMRRFPGFLQVLMTCDTITIEGKDRKNRYWKEVTYRLYNDDYYSFGYINVKESDLDKFNKVIDDAKIECVFDEERIAEDRQFSTDSAFQELLKSLDDQ